MKKVDAAFRDKISDLILENELSISEFALEKDFIVTDVLQAISKINNEKFNLVFCGGTCLSKAYGLLERVSEDVDIKLVPKFGVVLNANQRRTAISRLKKDIVQALLNIGFQEGNIQQIALDGNTCVEFNAEYSTYFDVHRIIERNPKITEDVALKSLLLSAMDKDAKDFMHQYPKFLTDPVGEIQNAMSVAKSKPEYRKMYGEFVRVMVYGKEVPSFEEAIMNFDAVLNALLPSANTNFNHYTNGSGPALYNQ